MKNLRISTSCNLHSAPKDDINEYLRQGLIFHKKMGFGALDCPLNQFNLLRDDWETVMETIVKDSREIPRNSARSPTPWASASVGISATPTSAV